MHTVKFVHYGADELEIGIQFETADGAGGTVKGRAFAPVDPALKAAVLADAQAKIDAMGAELPAELPPGAVTTALIQKRNALLEAAVAEQQKRAAEDARAAAETATAAAEAAKAKVLADLAAAEAAKAAIEAEIAAAEAAREAAKAAIEAEIAAAEAARDTP